MLYGGGTTLWLQSWAAEKVMLRRMGSSARWVAPAGTSAQMGEHFHGLLLWTMLVESDCWKEEGGKKQTVHCTVQCLPSWGSPAHPPGLYHLAPVAGTLEAVHQLQLGLHSLRVLWPWQGSQEIVKQWASQPSAATQLWQLWIDWFDIVNSFPHD